MLKDLLVPEEFLQLDKFKTTIELCDNTSFFAILGSDTSELSNELKLFLQDSISDLITVQPTTGAIHEEIKPYRLKDKFILIDLSEQKNNDFIKDLLFYRDFISDYNLKLIVLVQKIHYKHIIKTAIDLYNIATFSYLFETYKIDIIDNFDTTKLDDLLKEYRTKKGTLNKKQKMSYLGDIGNLYEVHGEITDALVYFNKALHIAVQIKDIELIVRIKISLSSLYRKINNYSISEKYLIDVKTYYLNKNIVQYLKTLETLFLLYLHMNEYDKALKINEEMEKRSNDINNKEFILSAFSNYLSFYSKQKDKEKSTIYWEKTYNLANQLNATNQIAELHQFKAIEYMDDKTYKKALIELDKAIRIFRDMNSQFMLNHMYLITSNIYYNLLSYDKSLIYAEWCYKYFKKNNLSSKLISTLRIMGLIASERGEWDSALKQYFDALKISKTIKNRQETYHILLAISSVYMNIDEFSKALEYSNQANKIYSKIENINNDDIIALYGNYADIYNRMENLTQAYIFYDKAIKLYTKEDNEIQAYLDELYAEILATDNKYDEALVYFNKVLKMTEAQNDLKRMMSVEENLGYLYKQMGNINMSKRFFTEAINKLQIINENHKKIAKLKQEIS